MTEKRQDTTEKLGGVDFSPEMMTGRRCQKSLLGSSPRIERRKEMQSISAKLVVVVVLACTGLVGRNGLVDFGLESRAGGAGRPSSNVPSDDPSGTHATAKWRQVRFRATIGTGETPSQLQRAFFLSLPALHSLLLLLVA